MIHADEDVSSSSQDDELDQEIFLKSLIYQSEYLLSVRGLGSGFSRDVSGEVSTIINKDLFKKFTIQNRFKKKN